MGRMIDVELEEERIKVSFPYDKELVDVVRTLPDRWYDRQTKTWFVPLQHLNYVVQRLDGYHFKFSPQLRKYQNEEGGEEEAEELAIMEVPDGTWTISGLNQAARAALKERFDQAIWIVGELQDFEKNRASNYRTFFFDLVERPFAGANEVARLKAVLFDKDRQTIENRLKDGDISLADGLAVRLRGRVDLYPRNGRYQIIVDDIDPAYTAGEIEMNRERVFRALKKRGIETKNQRRSWPVCPLRVGLITSYESDAYNDFVHQLKESGRGFSVAVHHANVQGVHTERSVLRALEYFRERADDFDVVAIVRGGGSRSELAYFDTESIGEAVCQHPLKIVCGVGHQRDTCLLDLIAESTKTPTAAAEQIVGKVDAFMDSILDVYGAIARHAERKVATRRQRLVRSGTRLERQVLQKLQGERRRQDRIKGAVGEGVRAAVMRRRRELDQWQRALKSAAAGQTDSRRRKVEQARYALSMRRLSRQLQLHREELERRQVELRKSTFRDTEAARQLMQRLEEQLELVDPRRILERGFAMVRDENGLVRSRDQIASGHDFDVVFGDGVLRARRIDAEPEGEESAEDIPAMEPVE